MLAQHACKNGEQLKGPPLRALHQGAWHAEAQKFFASLPVKGLTIEDWLHKVLEILPVHDSDINFLSQIVRCVGEIESECGSRHAPVQVNDEEIAPANMQCSRHALCRSRDHRSVDRLQKALRAIELDKAEPAGRCPNDVVASDF